MDLRPYLNRFVALGAIAVAGFLTLVTLISIGWTSPRLSPGVGFAPAYLTMIPPPTHTPAIQPTQTVDPSLATPAAGEISIKGYVQISGTGSDGLRIRAVPGLNGETVFRGEEAEVFIVRDGPRTADGYTWWYLVAPYDETRAGWAAADFLSAIPSP